MSKREPRRRRPPTPPSPADEADEAPEALTGHLGATTAGGGSAAGHTAKRQRTGTGREEQIHPHQGRAAEER
ncbi:hypothetical protein ACIPUC_12260 [Streptomyces sp. LARHCF249]